MEILERLNQDMDVTFSYEMNNTLWTDEDEEMTELERLVEAGNLDDIVSYIMRNDLWEKFNDYLYIKEDDYSIRIDLDDKKIEKIAIEEIMTRDEAYFYLQDRKEILERDDENSQEDYENLVSDLYSSLDIYIVREAIVDYFY